MGPDDDGIPGPDQAFDHALAVSVKDAVVPPGGRQQNRSFPVLAWAASRLLQLFGQVVQLGQTHEHRFLPGQSPQLLQRPDFPDLEFPVDQHGVVVIGSEHPVSGNVVGGVHHVRVPFYIPGPLPLVYVEPRRAGQHHVRPQKVHPGEGLVPLSGEFGFDVLVLAFQQGIVRRGGQIQRRLPPFFHFVAQGFEDGLIAFAVGEKHNGLPGLFAFLVLSAVGHEPDFDQHVPKGVDQNPQNADQDGEEHAPRTGIDVQTHGKKTPCQIAEDR